MASKLRLIILGAPGSGKGTISSRIVNDFRLNHLSSGNLLRENINKKTSIGLKVSELVAQGKFVPDDLISKMILNKLNELRYSSWLLDGFPRNLKQCQALEKNKMVVDKVVNLNVPFEVIINRLKHRWIHPASGRVYNLEFNPPKVNLKDDLTGDPLIQRADDQEEVVLRRLKDYESQTKPIIDYYSKLNLLETYTGNTSDSIWPSIKNDIGQLASLKNELAKKELNPEEAVTHTGQKYDEFDPRRVRFVDTTGKKVNKNFAIDLVAADPIVVTELKTVVSSGGGPLGHPKVYINVDKNQVHVCDYSGRRFIKKKFYDEAIHGKSIDYDTYLEQVARFEQESQQSKN